MTASTSCRPAFGAALGEDLPVREVRWLSRFTDASRRGGCVPRGPRTARGRRGASISPPAGRASPPGLRDAGRPRLEAGRGGSRLGAVGAPRLPTTRSIPRGQARDRAHQGAGRADDAGTSASPRCASWSASCSSTRRACGMSSRCWTRPTSVTRCRPSRRAASTARAMGAGRPADDAEGETRVAQLMHGARGRPARPDRRRRARRRGCALGRSRGRRERALRCAAAPGGGDADSPRRLRGLGGRGRRARGLRPPPAAPRAHHVVRRGLRQLGRGLSQRRAAPAQIR